MIPPLKESSTRTLWKRARRIRICPSVISQIERPKEKWRMLRFIHCRICRRGISERRSSSPLPNRMRDSSGSRSTTQILPPKLAFGAIVKKPSRRLLLFARRIGQGANRRSPSCCRKSESGASATGTLTSGSYTRSRSQGMSSFCSNKNTFMGCAAEDVGQASFYGI
jgi:hypothetical protein